MKTMHVGMVGHSDTPTTHPSLCISRYQTLQNNIFQYLFGIATDTGRSLNHYAQCIILYTAHPIKYIWAMISGMPNYNLNYYWPIIIQTNGSRLHQNLNQYIQLFFPENAFKESCSSKYRPFCRGFVEVSSHCVDWIWWYLRILCKILENKYVTHIRCIVSNWRLRNELLRWYTLAPEWLDTNSHLLIIQRVHRRSLFMFSNMGRKRQWPPWIKHPSCMDVKRLWFAFNLSVRHC